MLILTLLWATPALACVGLPDEEHVVDPESTDAVAPSAPEIGEVNIGRGQGPRRTACGSMVSSCDGSGWIDVAISATDDVSPPEAIGYRVEFVEGELPDGRSFDDRVVRARDGQLVWGWDDEAMDEQEPFDFTVRIYAVDEGGNESEPVELDVANEGHEERGCDATGGPVGAAAALVALLAAAGRARRPAPREVTG